MRRVRDLFGRQETQETPCPRCGVPAPSGSTECTACGWDVREPYHDPFQEADEAAGASDRPKIAD